MSSELSSSDKPNINLYLEGFEEKFVEWHKSRSLLKQLLTNKEMEVQELKANKINLDSSHEEISNQSQCPSVTESLEEEEDEDEDEDEDDEDMMGKCDKNVLEEIKKKIFRSNINNFTLTKNTNNFSSIEIPRIDDSLKSNLEIVPESYLTANDSSSNEAHNMSSNNSFRSDYSEGEFLGGNQIGGLPITETELMNLSVRQFNKRIHDFPLDVQMKLRKRRRTLKNRRYASSCRHRRQKYKEALESSNTQLEAEIHRCKVELFQIMKEVADLHEHNESLIKEIDDVKKENDSLIKELKADDMVMEKVKTAVSH